jgi:ABC-type polar amino acid transport system ATPase subunit
LTIFDRTKDPPPGAAPHLDDASPLLSIIREERTRRAFLVVTHHQGHARAVADDVVLLVSGRIVERSPSELFFSQPQTEIAAIS